MDVAQAMDDRFCRVKACSVIHPLGFSVGEFFDALKAGKTALRKIERPYLEQPACAALFSDRQNEIIRRTCPYEGWSRFEQLLWIAIRDVLNDASVKAGDDDLLFAVASTKGSIEEIDRRPPQELTLAYSVNRVLHALHAAHPPLIISNACISGLSVMIAGMNLLRTGRFKYVVAVGADTLSDFVLSGFNSLMALSPEICRPFDADRRGINLGEGAAALLLERSDRPEPEKLYCTGGAITNDANHISGPSRTGQELAFAVETALKQAGIDRPDFISAHGTATLFNDEMESRAFATGRLEKTPIHSLKAYLGHTLGAAGLIESAVCLQMIASGTLIPSAGYRIQGTDHPLNIQQALERKPIRNCLKTMSGFGGCNAAVCFQKMTGRSVVAPRRMAVPPSTVQSTNIQ